MIDTSTAEAPKEKRIQNGKCTCRTCTNIAKWRAALDIRTPEGEEAFQEILIEMEAIATDLGWYQAIHEGTWPQAVEILERALEKAKKVQEEEGFTL